MNRRLLVLVASGLLLAACGTPEGEPGAGSSEGTPSTGPTEGENLVWEDAATGVCVNDWTGYPGARSFGALHVADCDDRHDFQFVGVGVLSAADGPYPGYEVAEREAFEICAAAFDEFIGGPSEEVVLSWTGTSEDDFTRHSGEILCEVSSASGDPLLGSAEGIGQPGPGSGDNLILLSSNDFRYQPDQDAPENDNILSEQVVDGRLLLTPAQPNMSTHTGQALPGVDSARVTAVGGPAEGSTAAGVWGVAISDDFSSERISGAMLLCGSDGQASLWDSGTVGKLMQLPGTPCGPGITMTLTINSAVPGPSLIMVAVGDGDATAYLGNVDYGPAVAASLVVESYDNPGFTAAVSNWSVAAR